MNISGKVFIVTGGGSGIGRQLVLQLLRKGATVAAIDKNLENLQETSTLAGKLSEHLSLHELNLTDKNEIEKLPEAVLAKHGHIDALINNAGIIQPFVRINELDYTAIDKVLDVNFYGTLYMIKSVLPILLDRPEGYIVNISSMGGFLPVPGQSIYGASKAAVKLMTEGLSSELSGTNVRVSVVFPGAVATNISANSNVKIENLGENEKSYAAMPAEEAAREIIAGIEKNKVRIFVGKDSRMMNLLYRISPGFATNLITKKMKDLLKGN